MYTMTREDIKIEFTGLTHDHLMVNKQNLAAQQTIPANGCEAGKNCVPTLQTNQDKQNAASALSTIAILRRHPMYDSLVLVKRYRACLNGHTLEFPTSDVTNRHTAMQMQTPAAVTKDHEDCCKTKLVSVYLDGDDPIYQCQERRGKTGIPSPEGEMVYVPMNGLLDRLDNYDRHGVSIDSRVYAFAMGLKTAEKFLTTSSMKEIQETPPN